MMPVLLVLLVILLVRSVTLPGAREGIRYLLVPDWSYLPKPITWGMALGQAFFSVSLTGAGMLVYGSYLKKDFDIPNAAMNTVTLDTLMALMAALIIMPAAFAYQIDPAAGPPLLFITLVSVFQNMPGGHVIAILFFLGVLFAALSSLLAIKEAVVEAAMDQFSWSRRTAVLWISRGGVLLAEFPWPSTRDASTGSSTWSPSTWSPLGRPLPGSSSSGSWEWEEPGPR